MNHLFFAVVLVGLMSPGETRAGDDSGSFGKKVLNSCGFGFASLSPFAKPPPRDTPAMIAAKARAAQREVDRTAISGSSNSGGFVPSGPHQYTVEGIEVREFDGSAPSGFVPVSADEFIKIYGDVDPKKIIKAKEPTIKARKLPSAGANKWYRSILNLGDGHFDSVNYTIIETKPSGKVVIQFENPLHRGRIEKKEVMPLELQRGLKELDAPPKGLNNSDPL
ncbi:hypothetical protein BH10BDE1_BH10BDE1_28490 [soil metagenome]